MLWLFKRTMKMARKGVSMSEIREILAKSISEIRTGDLPLDTAEAMHLTAHRHVMDRYADDREARRISEKQARENMKVARQQLKDM